MPKLSIVVPVYNTDKYLNQCIDSILGQSFTDFEVIIVDDGSTDRSGLICDEYAAIDPRVVVIHTENHGAVTARRIGVNRAQGTYTTFVDSDDWLDQDYYRYMFEKADGTNADIIICTHVKCAAGYVKANFFTPGFYDKNKLECTVYPQMMYDTYLDIYHVSPSLSKDKIFCTELLQEVSKGVDSNITFGDDAVCAYPCIARANSVLFLENRACYNYRQDHFSMTNHCDVRLLQRVSTLADNMIQQFSDLPKMFDLQIQCYITYVSLVAAHKVLLNNRELPLSKRIKAVKHFFSEPIIAYAFQAAQKSRSSKKFRCKLYFALKNRPFLLFLLFKCNYMVHG